MNTGRLKSAALAGFIAVWFLGQTWKAILAQFDDDDLMNTYQAWTLPLSRLLIGNLTPFTSVYRPLGSLLYRLEYLLGGFDPLPFRIVAYALMLLNVWLIFRLARLLTGSAEIAILAALIGSYHKRLYGIYVNNGTIYDVLCFTFFCLALIFYVSTRQKPGKVTGWRLAGFCGLYTLALNSKEMAVSLPAVLLAYELIYRLRRPWTLSERGALLLSIAITAVAIKAKTAQSSPFTGLPDYTLHFSRQQFFNTTQQLVSQLFFLPENALSAAQVVVILALVWAIAAATRNKGLLLGAAMITVLPLPINFITYRGFFVMYLPLLGWAIYAATLLAGYRRRLPAPAVFSTAALFLFLVQSQDSTWSFDQFTPHQVQIRRLKDDLPHIRPSIPKGGSVLFLSDGFDADSWNPLYIVRLTYRDPAIAVDRVKTMPPGSAQEEKYSLVLDYKRDRYIESSRK